MEVALITNRCAVDDAEMVEEEEVVTYETINDLCAQLLRYGNSSVMG
jgi:hypothetical protein